jgi:hypothetical protein
LKDISYTIYTSVAQLPATWNTIAKHNLFLQTPYLSVLELSAPTNMTCFYIAVFENNKHIGVALAQYINVLQLESFGERDKCIKTAMRNFVLKNFASNVLFLGNNMITGQNGYAFSTTIDFECISNMLLEIAKEITQYFKEKKVKIHLVSFKDFYNDCAVELKKHHFKEMYEFDIQPNMTLFIDENWKTKEDYIASFSKKYRDQYKRAHKKFDGIVVKEFSANDILKHQETLYNLYHYVAQNAPFNTFFLSKNHFYEMKKQCDNRFLLFAYFLDEKLVGFHTLLCNKPVLETYFLGYDETIQKENMLYLNMLYNMTEYGIENGYQKIIFGRTALEIKSSIGAVPVKMSGFIYHRNRLINKYISSIFKKLEPEVQWQQRHPFK